MEAPTETVICEADESLVMKRRNTFKITFPCWEAEDEPACSQGRGCHGRRAVASLYYSNYCE